MAYDPPKDRYLIPRGHTLWAFSPETRKWEKILETKKSIGLIGYDPATVKIAEFERMFRWARRIDLQTRKTVELKRIGPHSRRGMVCGSLSSPGPDRKYLFFGGVGGGLAGKAGNATWLYDPKGHDFTKVKCGQSPSPRSFSKLSYNSALGVWVLFGGTTEGGRVSDMWIYNGALKTWIEARGGGPTDHRGGFGYDPVNDKHVMLCTAPRPSETWVCTIKAGK
jgi:hypothetical protein